MTIGNISSGSFPLGGTTHRHYAKKWTGTDGQTIPGQHGPLKKWNVYRMGMMKFSSSNPNQIGTKDPTTGIVTIRNNHAWNKAGGDAETIGYIPLFGSEASDTFPTSQYDLVFTAREELELLSKLLAKVKGHSFNIGVALAEVDKLATTISSTLLDLSRGVVYLKRGRFDQFARLFGAVPPGLKARRRLQSTDVSGRFLEMRYAWEPAIQDAFEAAKAFEQISSGPRVVRFHKGKRRVLNRTYHTNYCEVPQVITAYRSYIFEQFEEMGVARQMGLANPASILWERCPWSFVIDWFIPIGTYLELIGQIPFMKGRWLRTDSIKYQSSGTFQCTTLSNRVPHPPSVDCNWEVFHLRRTELAGPPDVPRPTIRVAGAVQGKRLQNAIALTHQVFSKTALGKGLGSFTNVLFDPTYRY